MRSSTSAIRHSDGVLESKPGPASNHALPLAIELIKRKTEVAAFVRMHFAATKARSVNRARLLTGSGQLPTAALFGHVFGESAAAAMAEAPHWT